MVWLGFVCGYLLGFPPSRCSLHRLSAPSTRILCNAPTATNHSPSFSFGSPFVSPNPSGRMGRAHVFTGITFVQRQTPCLDPNQIFESVLAFIKPLTYPSPNNREVGGGVCGIGPLFAKKIRPFAQKVQPYFPPKMELSPASLIYLFFFE